MAEAAHMETFLECSICLDTFDNPKLLICGHQFCKQCLEETIVFNADGSAAITCPLRCDVQTIVSVDKTINDLQTSFVLKGMLDALKTEETADLDIPKCEYDKTCAKFISTYCCEVMMCSTCYLKHKKNKEHQHHQDMVNLVFSKRENKLKVVCDEHFSSCTHLCIDNKFLCPYCVNRSEDHKSHSKNTIETDVELLRQALINDSQKKENVLKCRRITEENIQFGKRKFNDLLDKRHQECLMHYKVFLDNERERLKSEFENICNTHMKQYAHYPIPNYNQETLEKNDIVLAIEKNTILDTICKNISNLTLDCETVSVSEDFDFFSEYPLGSIEVTVGDEVSADDQPVPTLKYYFEVVQEKEKHEKLVDDHEKLSVDTEENSLTEAETDDKSKTEGSHCQMVECSSEKQIDVNGTAENKITKNLLKTKGVQAFLDVTIDSTPAGRIIMDLFCDVVPKTCENFMQLCTHVQGYGYKGSRFHGVYASCCVGGDITKGDGSGGTSIYGDKYRCENFIKKHDREGILSMLNRNSDGFTNSIFFIHTKARPECDGNHVVFGKVTEETYFVVEKIIALSGCKPCKDVVIVNCGLL